jgi:hypothetical protein
MRNAKILISVLIFTFIASVAGFGQNDEELRSIGSTVSLINKNLGSNTQKTKNVDGISLEGTEVTYYLSGRGLQKITAHVAGETFYGTVSVYYQGEEPIFAYYKYNRYDTQIGLATPPKVVHSEIQRFYFAGENIIQHTVDDRAIKSSDPVYNDNTARIKEMIEKLKAGYGM